MVVDVQTDVALEGVDVTVIQTEMSIEETTVEVIVVATIVAVTGAEEGEETGVIEAVTTAILMTVVIKVLGLDEDSQILEAGPGEIPIASRLMKNFVNPIQVMTLIFVFGD